jgi:hypothetical protein
MPVSTCFFLTLHAGKIRRKKGYGAFLIMEKVEPGGKSRTLKTGWSEQAFFIAGRTPDNKKRSVPSSFDSLAHPT